MSIRGIIRVLSVLALPGAAASSAGDAPVATFRQIDGLRVTWCCPESGYPAIRLSAAELSRQPVRMGPVQLGNSLPALTNPQLRIHLEELSDAFLLPLSTEWPVLVQASRRCKGPLEIVLRKPGEPELCLASVNWRLRSFAPGLDLVAAGGSRANAPALSIYWCGPGRGVAYAVNGRPADWPAFSSAFRQLSASTELRP